MNYISDILFWISTGLLVPTVVLLVLFFVRALLLVGGFFGQLLARRKADAQMVEVLDQLTAENVDTLLDKFTNPTRIAVQGDERHTVPPLKRKRVR